jgi:hypothetical protein
MGGPKGLTPYGPHGPPLDVIPAQAGIQLFFWVPACAGMTQGPPGVSFPRKWESSCFFLDSRLRGNDTGGGGKET